MSFLGLSKTLAGSGYPGLPGFLGPGFYPVKPGNARGRGVKNGPRPGPGPGPGRGAPGPGPGINPEKF